MKIVFAIIVGLSVGSFMTWLFSPRQSNPSIPEHPIGDAEVSDLIKRLKPFAYDPESDWRGVSVKFSGGGVSIELRTKNGNEYHGKSKTLSGAVNMIADPAPEIRDALKDWGHQ